MLSRRKTFITISVAISVAALTLWNGLNSSRELIVEEDLSQAQPQTILPTTLTVPQTAINDMPKTGDVALDNKLKNVRSAMLADNIPIDFSGRVVDQDGNPIPGVTVALTLNYYDGLVRAGYGSQTKSVIGG